MKLPACAALLDEHLAAENAHDVPRILATYGRSPTVTINGRTISGEDAIRAFHERFGFGGGGVGSFADVHVAERHRHVGERAIVVEQTLRGVHSGAFDGLAPTGRPFEVAVCTVYSFDEDDRLASERVYFDRDRLRKQLGG